jgi:hypothetical protein
MADPVIADPHKRKLSQFAWVGAFALDTLIVYTLALHVSGTLVSLWFAWAPRLFQISSIVRPSDWYLQHLEWMTVVPALLAGYIDIGRIVPALFGGLIKGRRNTCVAMWAWTIPTIILAYKMLLYHAPSSVLFASSMSTFRYFFDIQRVMPTFSSPFAGDTVRLVQQMTLTAPFYAGVAYSLGAVSYRYQIVAQLFSFEKPDETLPTDSTELPTPVSPSSAVD